MKIGIRKTTFASLIFLLAALLTGGYLVQQNVLAATGSIYLTPPSTSVTHGSNVQFNLRINPGASVDSAGATVNFDTTKLKFISADYSSSAFGNTFSQTVSGGTVKILRGITLEDGQPAVPVSSDALIETLTFQSLVYSGSASLTLTAANATSNGAYTDPSVGNANVTLTAGTCPSGQTGTPPDCTTTSTGGGGGGSAGGTGSTGSTGSSGSTKSGSTGGTTTTPSGTVVPTSDAPKPSITTTTIGFTSLGINATTSSAVQAYLEYGFTSKLGTQTALDTAGTTHSFTLDQGVIRPGMTYYYRVVSRSSSGGITAGDTQKVVAKGMSVKVKVVDKNNKPLAGKKVTLHSDPITGTTDKNGSVSFNNVTPGNHTLIYAPGSKSYSKELTIANNITTVGGEQTAPLQNFSVVYNVTQPTWANKVLPVFIFVIVAGLAFYIYRWRQDNNNGIGGHPLDPDLVVVGGAGQDFGPSPDKMTIEPQTAVPPSPELQQTTTPSEPTQPPVSSAFLSSTPPPAQPSTVVVPTVNKIEIR